MKKLVDLIEIAENNEKYIVLKVKDNVKKELIWLGCFCGNETMIRLTKGADHTCTIITQNDRSYSWEWGRSGCTLVSNKMDEMRAHIVACIETDLDIYIGDNISLIKESLNIQKVSDAEHSKHIIKATGPDYACIYKDGAYYKHIPGDIDGVVQYFKNLGYAIGKIADSTAPNGCKIKTFCILR